MRFSSVAALIAVCAACQNRVPGGPVPLAISPAQANQGQSVAVTITGQGFWPQVVSNFETASSSHLNTTFEVRLGSVSLEDVALQRDLSLTATTLPLSPGFYDLTVVSPTGQTGMLPNAFEVLAVQQGCDGGGCGGCESPNSRCPIDGGVICTDTQTDQTNCGVCGDVCQGGQVCNLGLCASTCTNTLCAGQCVDPQWNNANCGGCAGDGGVVCPVEQQCDGGLCVCPPAAPDLCPGDGGSFCADTQTDPANCGVCGNPCGAGLDCCAGGCVDTLSDPNNCGRCGTVCAAGDFCAADGGCLSFPVQCATAQPIDGDSRWIDVDAGSCHPASNGFIEDDAGNDVDCTGDGVCLADVSLDGGWYRFTGAHDQLFSNDGGAPPTPFHCGTEEPGWVENPLGPTPVGVPTYGNVCFADDFSACDYSALIQILNCGDAGYVYELPNFTGACSSPLFVNLGAYCTQ